MSQRTVGVAVVGCGAIGGVHARLVSELEGASLIALCDEREHAARDLAESLEQAGHLRPILCSSISDAVALPEVELVVLTTPSSLHVDQASTVLAAGRHVLIEKPLDTQLGRARSLLDWMREAEESDLVASVVSQHRFDKGSEVIAESLDRGDFGHVTSAVASTAWWRSQEYYDTVPWRGSLAGGGGALMNQSIHIVDLLLSFMGRPREVFGMSVLGAHERINVEDSAVATISFDSGAIATLHATTAAYPGLSTRLQVMGSRGSATLEDDELVYLHSAALSDKVPGNMGFTLAAGNEAGTVTSGGGVSRPDSGYYQLDPSSHRSQYVDVLAAIREGRRPRVTLEDAFHALALVKAVYASHLVKAPVAFDDVVLGKYDYLDAE